MSNMSYCRFENTAADVRDCLSAINEGITMSELSSDYERESFKRFLVLCCEVAELVNENHEDLNPDDAVKAFIAEECSEPTDESEEE